jgi:hypothetical protein
VSSGHPDAAILIEKWVYIVDLKRSRWGVPDGPRSLQLQAYGLACCDMWKAEGYTCLVWDLTSGVWVQGPDMDLCELDTLAVAEAVIAAAKNVPEEGKDPCFVTGPHCDRCWQRQHCREYLLPVADPEGALEPLSRAGGLTPANAGEALKKWERASVLMSVVEGQLKAFAIENGGIHADGQVWAERFEKSARTSVDRKAMEKDNPELFARIRAMEPSYTRREDAPRSRGFRWEKFK